MYSVKNALPYPEQETSVENPLPFPEQEVSVQNPLPDPEQESFVQKYHQFPEQEFFVQKYHQFPKKEFFFYILFKNPLTDNTVNKNNLPYSVQHFSFHILPKYCFFLFLTLLHVLTNIMCSLFS